MCVEWVVGEVCVECVVVSPHLHVSVCVHL